MSDWFDEGRAGHAVDVAAVLDSEGWVGLQRLVQDGALISLSTTKDAGALGVTITVDGRYRREYFRDSSEFTEWMAEAVPAVRRALDELSASRAEGNRGRRRRGL